MSHPVPNRRLAAVLRLLINRCEMKQDARFHDVVLSGGLMVSVGIGQKFNLRLSRGGSAPGAAEWGTIITYLPDAYRPPTSILPRDFEQDGRHYLAAEWDFQRRLL
jgi:hypothetical protein